MGSRARITATTAGVLCADALPHLATAAAGGRPSGGLRPRRGRLLRLGGVGERVLGSDDPGSGIGTVR